MPSDAADPTTDARPASGTSERPSRIGPYELLVELASGGMATVHLARAVDHRHGPPLFAVKVPHRHLSTDRGFLTMLVDEARLASAIDHPNVVKVHELGFHDGMPYIVMDYVDGASLADLRRELASIDRALDVRMATRIVLDALAGLQAAHDLEDESGRPLHIVHRDVSPHNILIGCNGRAHLTDFGIAKAEDRIQTTRTHEVKGKLAYLAPERIDKRRTCTIQSDVFSMAVVFWECFAGRRLFRAEEVVDLLEQVMTAPIPRLSSVGVELPSALDDVIARGLSRRLDERFPTAAAFARAITRAVPEAEIGTHAQVAELMEAVFGVRMARRQEQVRAAVGRDGLEQLLRASGLPSRELEVRVASGAPERSIAELAPKAPEERYAAISVLSPARMRLRRLPWWTIAAGAAGVLAGAMATLVVMRGGDGQRSRPAPQPGVATGAPTASVSSPDVPSPIETRSAGSPREPASTGESVPSGEPPSAASSTVVESPRMRSTVSTAHSNAPLGSTRDGFTKLR